MIYIYKIYIIILLESLLFDGKLAAETVNCIFIFAQRFAAAGYKTRI